MFHRFIKLIIAALLVATAIWQFTEGNIGNGIFLILLKQFRFFFITKMNLFFWLS